MRLKEGLRDLKPLETEKIFIERHFIEACEKGHAKKEEIVYLDALTGDASTRRYYRLVTKSKSYVVCLDRPFNNESEYTFLVVQKFLKSLGVRVPEVFYFVPSSGFLLEEDLGDTTLVRYLSKCNKSEELRIYKDSIDLLCKIHLSDRESIPSISSSLSFNYEKLNQEVMLTYENFWSLTLGDQKELYESEKRIVELEFRKINSFLDSNIKALCHRDYHSRNLMVLGDKNPELIVIDFQDARLGSYCYDLVSLLEDSYFSLDGAQVQQLRKYYFDTMKNSVSDFPTYSEFLEIYEKSLIQRTFKAIGSFSFIYKTRGDIRYLKYIGFAMEKLRHVFMANDQYTKLKENLFKIYYEN